MVKNKKENEEIELKKKKESISNKKSNIKNEIDVNAKIVKKRKNVNKTIKNNVINEDILKKRKNVKKILKDDNIDGELLKKESNKKNKLNKENIKVNKNTKTKSQNNKEINQNKIFEPKLKKKRKLKKKYKILLSILLIVIISISIITGIRIYNRYQEEQENRRIIKERNELIAVIKSHYNNFVVANKDTILYRIDENNNYYEYGMVYKDTELIIDDIEIDYLTEYFYSKDLECYVKYNDLKPINELSKYDNRYKKYVVFNQNIVTKDEFNLYDENDNKVYLFKKSMSFPIIIKNDNGKYFVEFNNRLLYVLKEDIKEIVNANNTSSKNASKITTLCYHRIYDSNHKCNDLYICKSKSNFEREMKYLSDNSFFTLTMEEMHLYLTKKIQVPRKSVVLTFDDGTLFELGIEILEKYDLHGTGFIKTGTFSDYTVYESPNFELQSHTDKMHKAGTCPIERVNQQGGGILCLKESTVLSDLKLSREKLNGAIALAYPFYDYNNRAIELVKKAGFKLAFIGANNVAGRAWPGINLYKVPRMTIWNTTSFETFKGYVNN